MDKLARRVRMVERQVARRKVDAQDRRAVGKARERLRQESQMLGHATREIGAAVRARREDWALGELAPRRDIPRPSDHGVHWGSLDSSRVQASFKLRPEELEARTAWAGGPDSLCLSVNDRAVIMEGPYKGKIGVIEQIDVDDGALKMKDLAKVNITMPSYMLSVMDMESPVRTAEMRIPISAVRLVHPIQDPETGRTRDVIIRELRKGREWVDNKTRMRHWERIVPGLNIKIPWPVVPQPTFDDNKCDTLRIDVEEKTFVPTLLRPPVPETLIDELRNRYSRFRTRHTDEYIAAKEAEEEAKRAQKKSADSMLTPLQEFNRLQREKRRALGQPELTEAMLAKIGEVMAKSGVEKVQGALKTLSVADAGQEAEQRPPHSP